MANDNPKTIPVPQSSRGFGYVNKKGERVFLEDDKKIVYNWNEDEYYLDGDLIPREKIFSLEEKKTLNLPTLPATSAAWLKTRLDLRLRDRVDDLIEFVAENINKKLPKKGLGPNQSHFEALTDDEKGLLEKVIKLAREYTLPSTLEKEILEKLLKIDNSNAVGKSHGKRYLLYTIAHWHQFLSKIFVQGSDYISWIRTENAAVQIAFKIVATLVIDFLGGQSAGIETFYELFESLPAFLKSISEGDQKCFGETSEYCVRQLWKPKTRGGKRARTNPTKPTSKTFAKMEDDPTSSASSELKEEKKKRAPPTKKDPNVDELLKLTPYGKKTTLVNLFRKSKRTPQENADKEWLKRNLIPFYGKDAKDTAIYVAFDRGTLDDVAHLLESVKTKAPTRRVPKEIIREIATLLRSDEFKSSGKNMDRAKKLFNKMKTLGGVTKEDPARPDLRDLKKKEFTKETDSTPVEPSPPKKQKPSPPPAPIETSPPKKQKPSPLPTPTETSPPKEQKPLPLPVTSPPKPDPTPTKLSPPTTSSLSAPKEEKEEKEEEEMDDEFADILEEEAQEPVDLSNASLETRVSEQLITMLEILNEASMSGSFTATGLVRLIRGNIARLTEIVDEYENSRSTPKRAIDAMIANDMKAFEKHVFALEDHQLASVYDHAADSGNAKAIQMLIKRASN